MIDKNLVLANDCTYYAHFAVSHQPHMKLLSFLFWGIVVANANAQINSGTVIIVGVSKDKVIVAADSRVMHGRDDNGNYIHQDGYCKIATPEHKFVYGATGLVGYISDITPRRWRVDAMDDARSALRDAPMRLEMRRQGQESCKAPSCTTPIPNETFIEAIAETWWTNVATKLMMFSTSEMDQWLKDQGGGDRVSFTGVFAGITSPSDIQVFVRSYTCKLPKPSEVEDFTKRGIQKCSPEYQRFSINVTPNVQWFGFGITDIVAEYLGQSSPRSKEEIKQWANMSEAQIAVRLVDLTIAFSADKEKVGPPIDVVELRSDGTITWLQNPQNCKED